MKHIPNHQQPPTPKAPKEPSSLERLKHLLAWGQRKLNDSTPTQGIPTQGAEGGETP